MKQFLIQYLKDFRTHFYNFTPYVILGGYCLLSFFSALYLGDYFSRESDILNSYFSSQPIILMLIIPAITMRSWADENKSGTLELLLTLPLSYSKLALAKFMATYSFFCFMVLFSLPFFFLTNKFSVLDIHVVLLSYLGLLLCGALFTAIGCLVSIFNRNIILCYITTIFAIFSVMCFNMDSIAFRNIFISLQCLVFENNYNAFLSGVISWHNIVYFILFIILLLWLNTITIECKKADMFLYKKQYIIFIFSLIMILCFSVIGTNLTFNHSFDLSSDHRFTLSSSSQDILSKLDKRIDITLYEAKKKREDADSSYAVYAEYVEKFFKLIEYASQGLVRVEFVQVEPFSDQERHLINSGVPYDNDDSGYKVFMAAEFSDNEANHASINTFPSLRQNLLEADIMRIIQHFGLPKKNIAIFSSSKDLQDMPAFEKMLKEFYNVSFFEYLPHFIPPTFDVVIFINPYDLSSESFLAMEQYVFNGGNLLIFCDSLLVNNQNISAINNFMETFGITLNHNKSLRKKLYNNSAEFIMPTTISSFEYLNNIRSVIVNGAGNIDISSSDTYQVYPILYLESNPIAAVSIGKFVSNYLHLAEESDAIEPLSTTTGKMFFFYDSNILKNYLFVSNESKSNDFYAVIPTSDNMLFLLNLLDFATNENLEKKLVYRHLTLNHPSIGHVILNSIKSRYESNISEIKKQLNTYKMQQNYINDIMNHQSYNSAKTLEDAGFIAQNIDEKEDELNRLNASILSDYQFTIIIICALIIFIFPAFILLLMAILLYIVRAINLRRIRRIAENV